MAQPRFGAVIRMILREIGVAPESKVGSSTAFQPGLLKDPCRLHEKVSATPRLAAGARAWGGCAIEAIG